MEERKELFEEFERLVEPISKFIIENYTPHTTVVITDNFAKIVEDSLGLPIK